MHILLAEDDDFLRKVFTDQLSAAGYTMTCAEDGQRALELSRTQKFDLILCDVLMPRMDGFAFLEAAQKEKTIDGTPIIMLTNVGDAEAREKAAKLGVKEYFLKTGMNIDELTQLMKVFAPLP